MVKVTCPECGADNDSNATCRHCGLPFDNEKLQQAPPSSEARSPLQPPEVNQPYNFKATLLFNCTGKYRLDHLKLDPGECTAPTMHYHHDRLILVLAGALNVHVARPWTEAPPESPENLGENIEIFLLPEFSNIVLRRGTSYNLENVGKICAEVLIVRHGSYFSEDDRKV